MIEAAFGECGDVGEVVITTGSARGGDRRLLAALLYEGYARKAATLQVDRETALAVLGEALNLDLCLVAVRRGSAVGVIGLVEGRALALEFPFTLLRRHLGVLRSVAYSLMLSVRHCGRPAADELVLEALAVSPQERNQGIGTRLLGHAEAYAREKGYSSVGLEVTDSNHTAIRLYARLGYAIVKTRRYPFVTRWAGFGGSHYMRKCVQATRCPDNATD